MPVSSWVFSSAVLAIATHAAAAGNVPVPLPDRVRGSESVVVAKVMDLHATYETNEYGDQLIVSHVTLHVEESLKGKPERSLEVDVVGGTVGNVTLDVSNMPRVYRGERAVFFLTPNSHSGKLVPYLAGQGILKLDAQNRVKGTSLDLTTIRQMASAVAGR